MVASPALGLDITSIGVITSIFPLCYGCSKFVSGVVGDVLSPSIMLGGGLIATGIVNIAFGASATLPFFCFLWAVNGILQGFGAPSCAKILTSWFAAKERGTYWVSKRDFRCDSIISIYSYARSACRACGILPTILEVLPHQYLQALLLAHLDGA
mmetsp:Transcript_10895/g.49116  ORF Transcript_10895/g.49116 Transcript_10895/m.49116 type:complete len:155 (+) Transcript_10895:763-1227(+)